MGRLFSLCRDQGEMTDAQRAKAQAGFLDRFAQCGIVKAAAQAAGINRTTVYGWLESDPVFKAAYQIAEQDGVDELEMAALTRAVDGVEEPVYQRGECVGYVTKYSDSLLMRLLEARNPEKFGRRAPGAATGQTQDGPSVGHEVHVTFEVVEDWRKVRRPS